MSLEPREKAMRDSQGIDKTQGGEMQPADKDRAQTVHKTASDKSASREATRDPKLEDHPTKPGSS
jgi:hypothetical protein